MHIFVYVCVCAPYLHSIYTDDMSVSFDAGHSFTHVYRVYDICLLLSALAYHMHLCILLHTCMLLIYILKAYM